MKIALLFTGILRTNLEETLKNIELVCSEFRDHDVRSYFVTWTLPSHIENKIRNVVDEYHSEDEPPAEWVIENIPNFKGKEKPPLYKVHRGASYLNIFYMVKCRVIAMNFQRKSSFRADYTLLTRNDAHLSNLNLNKWFNDQYNTSQYRHSRINQDNYKRWPLEGTQINDHFAIAPTDKMNKIWNLDDMSIKDAILCSTGAENLVYNLTKMTEQRTRVQLHDLSLENYHLLDGVNGNKHTHRT